MLSHGEKRRVTAAGRRCGKWEASQQGLNLGGRRGTFNTRSEVGSPELLGWPMVILHASSAPIITMVFLLSAPRWMPLLQPLPPIMGRKHRRMEGSPLGVRKGVGEKSPH